MCKVFAIMAAIALLCVGAAVPAGAAESGKIVGWGYNGYGQCNVPSPNTGFVAVSTGYEHSLGLKADGSIVAWWYNYQGQCNVPSPNTGFVAVAAGGHQSLGLKADGSIVAWGWGQCSVPSPNTGFTAVAAGCEDRFGLKADGSIVAWGSNSWGQSSVPSPNTGFVAVVAGWGHSLGLKADGSIVAWGLNNYGQCNVPSPNTGFVAVAGGYWHSLGLKADGSIVAWGDNSGGECDVPSPNTGFVAVAGGYWHSLGLKADGSIVAWGYNSHGECNVPSPNTGFVAVAAGAWHSLGLKSDTPSSLSPQASSLRMTAQPPEAAADGAQWRRVGTTTWHDSGYTETGVPVGVYAVEFNDVVSWVKPARSLVYVPPVGISEASRAYRPYWIGEAKLTADGTLVQVNDVVTAAWDDFFYIEAQDKSSGIRVESADHGKTEGDSVYIIGALGTTLEAERYILPSSITDEGSGSVNPIGIPNRSLGGGDFGYDPGPPESGQRGITGGAGLNNIGLLVRVWGRVTEVDGASTPTWFKIDDGSGRAIKCIAEGGSPVIDPLWQGKYAVVTGISSCELDGENLVSKIRLKKYVDPTIY